MEGLRLLSGKMITEVNEEGYRYLGIIELDKVKEQGMKLEFRAEYMRRLKLIMKSKLHGRNKIKAINTWAVSLLRYGAGIIEWTKEDLQKMDRKTRKVITMNRDAGATVGQGGGRLEKDTCTNYAVIPTSEF